MIRKGYSLEAYSGISHFAIIGDLINLYLYHNGRWSNCPLWIFNIYKNSDWTKKFGWRIKQYNWYC